jgi:hypothetical protein
LAKALIRAVVPLKRIGLPLLVSLGLLVVPPLARGSDITFRRALRPYVTRLTADIGYLSSFSTPSKSAAGGVLQRLSKIRSDLTGATRAATRQRASTNSGRTGRVRVLSALHDATAAAGDASACATAARAGNRSAAKGDQTREQSEINKAIPLFESGGKLLRMF